MSQHGLTFSSNVGVADGWHLSESDIHSCGNANMALKMMSSLLVWCLAAQDKLPNASGPHVIACTARKLQACMDLQEQSHDLWHGHQNLAQNSSRALKGVGFLTLLAGMPHFPQSLKPTWTL